jgi:hypothetical protein
MDRCRHAKQLKNPVEQKISLTQQNTQAMKKKIILSVLTVLALGAGLYGYTEYNRTHEDLSRREAQISITAPELIAAFEKDTALFQKQYTDKIIAVNGVVKRIDREKTGAIISLGEEGTLSAVQCSMDSAHNEQHQTLKEGSLVNIKGVCTGGRSEELFGTDVILNRCVIVNPNTNNKK